MSHNIRLLQIVPSLNSGGVEIGTIDIARAISDSGNFSAVASNGGRLVSLLKKHGSKHFNLPVGSKNPYIMYKNYFELKKLLINEKINIMHIRSRAPAWPGYFAGKGRVKLVSTFHNIYGHENFIKKFYNSKLGEMDKIIAISNFVKNKIVKIYNIPEDKITVIPRGIDERKYNLDEINQDIIAEFINKYNIIDDKKIILYPGRLTEWKGQIEFLNVLKKLKSKDFFCYFVGDDKNFNYTKKLTEKISDLQLNNHCKITGHIDEMKYIYKISHLVVNASQKPEGFGRVVSEAMAMGKIVVAYDHGGVSEQIAINSSEFKIPLNDNEKMAASIDKALNMPKNSIDSVGRISSAYIKKNFTKDNMILHTKDLYENLLSL